MEQQTNAKIMVIMKNRGDTQKGRSCRLQDAKNKISDYHCGFMKEKAIVDAIHLLKQMNLLFQRCLYYVYRRPLFCKPVNKII